MSQVLVRDEKRDSTITHVEKVLKTTTFHEMISMSSRWTMMQRCIYRTKCKYDDKEKRRYGTILFWKPLEAAITSQETSPQQLPYDKESSPLP